MPSFNNTALRLVCFSTALATAATVPAIAQQLANSPFPIVLTTPKQLNEIGLALDYYDENHETFAPALQHRCYIYGRTSGVVLMSFSDKFFDRYRKLGFSKESLCLALVSQAQYDPETGKRLPTYIIRNEDRLKEIRDRPLYKGIFKDKKLTPQQIEKIVDENVLSLELPLVVPTCFKNGTPYLDCTWRYGLTTGVPVRSVTAAHWRAFGEAWDRRMTHALKNGKIENRKFEVGSASPEVIASGYMPIGSYWGMSELYQVEPKDVQVPDALWQNWTQMTWTVLSPNLPRGYGYALNATGELGSGISLTRTAQANLGRRLTPQLSVARLREATAP
jgi:hypothetical protein